VILLTIDLSAIGLATAFAAGFASFVTPCVLPLVPAYLSVVSGVAAEDLGANTRRVTLATAAFVGGFTVAFSALGAGVGWAGSAVLAHRRPLEVAGGAFMIVMGAALLGFGATFFGREWRVHRRTERATLGAAALLGFAFAIGWTPCIGPVLAAILTFAAQTGPLQGAALLVAYSLGLGVPFLLAGLGTSTTLAALGVFRRHGALVVRVSGLVMIGAGLLLASGELTRISAELAT
jgi:cytochrome c-type biogenesis protein